MTTHIIHFIQATLYASNLLTLTGIGRFSVLPCFLAICFIRSEVYGSKFEQFVNLKDVNMCCNLEMNLQIFPILAHTIPC